MFLLYYSSIITNAICTLDFHSSDLSILISLYSGGFEYYTNLSKIDLKKLDVKNVKTLEIFEWNLSNENKNKNRFGLSKIVLQLCDCMPSMRETVVNNLLSKCYLNDDDNVHNDKYNTSHSKIDVHTDYEQTNSFLLSLPPLGILFHKVAYVLYYYIAVCILCICMQMC